MAGEAAGNAFCEKVQFRSDSWNKHADRVPYCATSPHTAEESEPFSLGALFDLNVKKGKTTNKKQQPTFNSSSFCCLALDIFSHNFSGVLTNSDKKNACL